MSLEDERPGYEVPSYRAPDGEPWFHFLHGNVPGHQIDFMYRPEVPQAALTRQHFSHLARLMKYIEPQTNAPYAFAIGNLSRDDTQHEPGHGGVALIFGLRIRGAKDHAGRQDPPFSHAVAAIDRELDAPTLLAAARAFHRNVFGAAESAEWYRSYVRCATEAPAGMIDILAGYVAGFADMPALEESSLSPRWSTGGAVQPKRIVIVHADDAPFDEIARCATRIAAMLYPSDVKWTAISNGREADVPQGVTIRFVAESALTAADEALGPRRMEDVPEDEADIAQELFGAAPTMKRKPAALGWRERYSAMAEPPSADGSSVDIPRATWEGAAPRRPLSERPRAMPAAPPARDSGVPARTSSPAGDLDLDAPTVALDGGGPGVDVSFEDPPADHASFDEAVTVGAPLRRVSSPEPPPPSKSNGALDVARRTPARAIPAAPTADAEMDDGGDRRASLDLLPPAPAEKQETLDAGLQRRETVAVSPAQVKASLEAVLPFRPATPDGGLTRPTADVDEMDSIPNFRRSSGSGWKWLIITVLLAAGAILALYLIFADSAPPSSGVDGAASASAEKPPASASIAPLPSPAPSAAPAASARSAASAAPSASAASSGKGKGDKKKPNKKGGIFDPTRPQILD